MSSLLKRAIVRLRVSLFPTEHDREFERWRSDNPDEELRYAYDLDSKSLVMDLGGYKGQWASDIYARYNCDVLVFEPVKRFAQSIQQRFKGNSRIEVLCLALGNSRRQHTIALRGDSSSVYRDGVERETIEFEDVAELFRARALTCVDLLKVNIEGGEYELMPRLIETGLISCIKRIQIQFHNVAPDSEERMQDIWRQLEHTHRVTYRYKFVWENWQRLDP